MNGVFLCDLRELSFSRAQNKNSLNSEFWGVRSNPYETLLYINAETSTVETYKI